jgi:tetratricopeptide (TPR) repeat protein
MSQPKGPKRATTEPAQWQLQVEGGRIVGPLTTEDLLYRISEGILTGQEKIRKLPDGAWSVVSREPIFYDKLLEALAEEQPKEDLDITVVRKVPVKTEAPAPLLTPLTPDPEPQENLPAPYDPQNAGNAPSSELPVSYGYNMPVPQPQAPPRPPQSPPVFTKPARGENRGTKKPIIMMVIVLLLGLVGYALLTPQHGEEARGLHLKLPKPGTKTLLTVDEQNKAQNEIYKLIFSDSIESYEEAQNKLVNLIEKAPTLPEPRGLLCVVQLQLWPFVQQDSRDVETFKLVRTAAIRLDPVGLSGVHCDVSYLMVLGKYRDAMGIIEHTSNRREVTEDSPILYSLKGEILAAEQNFREAVGWAESAEKLWPQWVHTYYQAGTYYFEMAQTDRASEAFEKILFLNPKHRPTLIEYGVLIYLKRKDNDAAEKFLTMALKSHSMISKNQEAKMYFYLAKLAGEKKQNDKALEYVQKAYQLNPGDLKARDFLIQLGGSPTNLMKQNKHNELVFLGDQYARAGDCLAAQAEYKAAFEIDQKNSLAAVKAARCLWQLYQAEEALRWLGKAIVSDPKLSMPYYMMADYYSQLFNFQGAGEILAKGAQKLPNNADILRGYGLVELRRNNFQASISYLERALKISEDVDTLILLAKAYITKKDGQDSQKAMAYATKAVQLEDTNPDAQVIYAKVLVYLGGVPQAENYMREKIQKYSYTQEYTLGLAEIYKEAERFRDAQNEYEKIYLLDSKNKKALMGLGECYQAEALLEKALKMYLAAAIQDPSDPDPVFRAGLVYMEAGRYKEALSQFQRGVNINKVFPKGFFYVGKAALALKEFGLAIQAANEEKKNNPSLADAYILAGDVYKEMREYGKCATEYQSVIRLRPKGAESYVKLAQCHLWAGNLDIAENMLAIAADQENGYADIYKLQGSIFEKKNENPEAVAAYEKYLSLAPNAVDKNEINNRINSLGGQK